MRVGVLTGGGDVPGLNASIKAVVNRVVGEGHHAVGIRRGWAGLLECNPESPKSVKSCTMGLDPGVVRTIDRSGGTVLHSSRTNPARVKAGEVPAGPGSAGCRRRARTTSPSTASACWNG